MKKNLTERVKRELYEAWLKKDYLMLIIWTLIIGSSIAGSLKLIWIFAIFIAGKFELLIICGTIVLIWFLYLKFIKQEKIAKKSKQNQTNKIIEKELHENNYICIRKCLFDILDNDISEVLGLKKPARLSELDAPGKITVKGNVFLYQFVMLKKSNEIDCNSIKEILQKEINEALDNFRIAGIRQTKFISNGVAIHILNVDSVKDLGNYIQLELVWASDDYVDLIETRKNILAEKLNEDNSFYDTDF